MHDNGRQLRKNYLDHPKRIVIKVGSNVLTETYGLNLKVIGSISKQICHLIDKGIEVILVSSGAMASGLKKIGLAKRPDEIPKRQAIAALGQPGLIVEYEKAFGKANKKVAQILLTRDDLSNRRRYLNARNCIYTLLSWDIVPIINENDTVVIEEIKFGDNDNLAAMITLLMDADLLINLTDIDGLYSKDPRVFQDAQLISTVSSINKEIEHIAGGLPGALGTGGMGSKIKAAKKLMTAGIPMFIACGKTQDIITKLIAGKLYGTFFVPAKARLANKKSWLAFTVKPKGCLVLDQGAIDAIVNNGKSLLPSGIVSVMGHFGVGEPVEFKSQTDETIGIGLTNYSADDITKIMGLKTNEIKKILGAKPYDEVIHRDHLAITRR